MFAGKGVEVVCVSAVLMTEDLARFSGAGVNRQLIGCHMWVLETALRSSGWAGCSLHLLTSGPSLQPKLMISWACLRCLSMLLSKCGRTFQLMKPISKKWSISLVLIVSYMEPLTHNLQILAQLLPLWAHLTLPLILKLQKFLLIPFQP